MTKGKGRNCGKGGGTTSVKGGYGGENYGEEASTVTDRGGLLSMSMGILANGKYTWPYMHMAGMHGHEGHMVAWCMGLG